MFGSLVKIFSLIAVVTGLVAFVSPVSADSVEKYEKHFSPLPSVAVNKDNPLNPSKVKLGKFLYFEPRLSKSNFLSCNSCHSLSTAGVDNLSTSIGHGWQIGPRNAPTVLNAALLGSQFWDGRAKDVEEQAGGPILNPGEMAADEELVLTRLASMPEYVELFNRAFPEEKTPLNYKNVAKAIAAFERTLMTPSPFDAFLNGDEKSLSREARAGLDIFIKKGCVACHNGVAVGGSTLVKFDYGTDEGRFEVTKMESDRKVFRVASLRNVALTYPYFHDGEVWTLTEAIKIMGEKQLGLKLTDEETEKLVAFLNSLTGVRAPIEVPILPASTMETPGPVVN
jgi:cytochrome c peroxidase